MALKNQVENIRKKKQLKNPLMMTDLLTQELEVWAIFRRQDKLSPQKNKQVGTSLWPHGKSLSINDLPSAIIKKMNKIC